MTRFTIILSPARQRAVALGLTLIVCFACLGALYSWIALQWEHHEQIALLARQVSARRALIKQLPQWEAELARVQGSSAWQQRLIAAPTPGQPGPLQRLVIQYGGVPDKSSTESRPVGSAVERDEDIRFSADITALTHILHAIRSSHPLLLVNRLRIVDTERTDSAVRTVPNKLQVEMAVTGYEAPK